MNVIVGSRQSGKTEALLRWAQEGPKGECRVIVTHSLRESMRLLRLARERGLPLDSYQFVSYQEVREGGFEGRVRPMRKIRLALDNADITIGTLLGARDPIDIITVTGTAQEV